MFFWKTTALHFEYVNCGDVVMLIVVMLIVVIGWNVKRMRWQEDENMRSEASQELVESVAASDVLAYRCSSDISQIYSTTIETDVHQMLKSMKKWPNLGWKDDDRQLD